MFSDTVKSLLETIAASSYGTNMPLSRGPDVNWTGAIPSGFKGDSFNTPNIQVKVKKKKKKPVKKLIVR